MHVNLNSGDSQGVNIRITSWNVKGLNSPIKRAKILKHLKYLKTDVAFLQETHLKIADHFRIRKSWVGQVYHSNFDSKARGTAILFSKKTQFVLDEIINDHQGRFIVVSGILNQVPVVLVNIYAPNWDDAGFINTLVSKIPNLNSRYAIFGGDLNCVMNPIMDRSNPKAFSLSKKAAAIANFMNEIGCLDPWRFANPNGKIFSFFSHAHQSYSRIDYFFVDKTLLPYVKNVDYSAIVESDHAPVLLDIHVPSQTPSRSFWKFNMNLLSDEQFCQHIDNALESFITTNKLSCVSSSLLWETLKAVIRGEIISYSSSFAKKIKCEQDKLIESIKKIDRQYSISPTSELYKDRLTLQTQYNLLSTEKTERDILRSRGHVYEHGEKASRLLAHQLKSKSASKQIFQIYNTSQEITLNPTEINNTFKSYYSQLYSSEMPRNITTMDTFFANLNTPTLNSEQKLNLDKAIELSEIKDAIYKIHSGKAPGPDGFPIEFYKKFEHKLAPLLLDMFVHSMEQGTLPSTLTEATIILLHKSGKDPLKCNSYRPISLLNSDIKIFAKIIASRLETVISDLVSQDQTGFIPGRHSFTNIHRVLHVMHSSASSAVPEIIVSLDAEKAFDRVEWEYLFKALEKFGFGQEFISLIRLLYSHPKAAVVTNNIRSQPFSLSRGTRQGCPLSPLLFALAIEPLSIALKNLLNFKGICRGTLEHKLSLYADDLLLYVSDPVSSIPYIVDTLYNFGSFSGYKLNYAKSQCFPINSLAKNIKNGTLPFPICKSGFKYLGVEITETSTALKDKNFNPLLEKMRQDFKRWGTLYLSLIGRINCIKMITLPRFIYLFQAIPCFLPNSFFKIINKAITSFIWNGKKPRTRLEYLQEHSKKGGLGLPNFRYYYWAANMIKVVHWFNDSDWYKSELNSCPDTSLTALITAKLPYSMSQLTLCPVVRSTLRIWFQFRKHFNLLEGSSLAPICNNHFFPPGKSDITFKNWRTKGIQRIKDLYVNGLFVDFKTLATKYMLDPSNLFRYFQIRDYVRKSYVMFPNIPKTSIIDKILESQPTKKGFISDTLKLISSLKSEPHNKLREDWSTELGEDIPLEIWNNALQRVNNTSICSKLNLIQFKVLHRMHYCKTKILQMYPNSNLNDACDRCSLFKGDLTHMFWNCPKLTTYWSTVFKILSDAFNINLQPSAEVAIFGVTKSNNLALSNNKKNIIAFSTLLARRRILLEWKSLEPPKASLWLKDLLFYLKLEQVKYAIGGSREAFFNIWGPMLDFVKHTNTLDID